MTTITAPVTDNETENPVSQEKDTVMKLIRGVQLINEALSRARMRAPQTPRSEATRPARQIMMSSRRREHDRLLGI
jgi:hypothetical protein